MKNFALFFFALALFAAPPLVSADEPANKVRAQIFAEDSAEEPARERTALEDRSTSFQAVTGPVTEDVPGGTLLISAYLAMWVAAMLYLLRLSRIGRRIDEDLSALKEGLPVLAAEARGAEEGDV